MAPSTEIVRRASSLQRGDIGWVVGIAVAGSLLLCLIFVSVLLIRRWRKRRLANERYVHSSADRTHKFNLSDASSNPLLEETRSDWRSREKQLPTTRQSIEEVMRENRETHVKGPTRTYSLFVAQNPNPAIASTSRPNQRLDPTRSTDKPYQFTSPGRPQLPPLTIPDQVLYTIQPLSGANAVVAEGTLPTQSSPSSCPSTESLYSQLTMDSSSGPSAVTYSHLPLTQEMIYGAESPEEVLKRGDTHLVGNLLKARAQRNPAGLVRGSSQVSRIERTGSIKSVASINKNDRPYSKRYRSQKKKTMRQNSDMEVVMETSENGSLRSSSSSYPPPWDPALLVRAPPPAALPPQSFLIMDN